MHAGNPYRGSRLTIRAVEQTKVVICRNKVCELPHPHNKLQTSESAQTNVDLISIIFGLWSEWPNRSQIDAWRFDQISSY